MRLTCMQRAAIGTRSTDLDETINHYRWNLFCHLCIFCLDLPDYWSTTNNIGILWTLYILVQFHYLYNFESEWIDILANIFVVFFEATPLSYSYIYIYMYIQYCLFLFGPNPNKHLTALTFQFSLWSSRLADRQVGRWCVLLAHFFFLSVLFIYPTIKKANFSNASSFLFSIK